MDVEKEVDPHEYRPNEFLIALEASAIRMTWTREEERRRRAATNGWMPPDLSAEHARLLGKHSVSARE